MKILVLILFPFAVSSQTLTDSTIIPLPSGTIIRYVTSYGSVSYNSGLDSVIFKGTVSKRRGVVSPLDLPIGTATQTALDGKQNTLVSGTNIKTVNGNNILGTGDVPISGSAAWGSVTGTLSNQTDLNNALNGKQASGTYATGTGSATGTNTGDNAVNSLYSGLVTNANHTGDATGSTALTLATVNSNVGSFTNANITVNGKGLITAASNGSGGAGPTFINLASNFSSTSTTPATVTGWSFAVTTGKTYRITVIADYQTAATTTGGIIGISLTTATGTVRGAARGTVVNTAAASELVIPIRATSGAGSTLTTTGVTAASSPHFISIDITFTCTNTGTFNIVWATEVAASAAQINANSSLIYQALN